jgi:hypothetical protein
LDALWGQYKSCEFLFKGANILPHVGNTCSEQFTAEKRPIYLCDGNKSERAERCENITGREEERLPQPRIGFLLDKGDARVA